MSPALFVTDKSIKKDSVSVKKLNLNGLRQPFQDPVNNQQSALIFQDVSQSGRKESNRYRGNSNMQDGEELMDPISVVETPK